MLIGNVVTVVGGDDNVVVCDLVNGRNIVITVGVIDRIPLLLQLRHVYSN